MEINPASQVSTVEMDRLHENDYSGFRALRELAEKGNPEFQFQLAEVYARGAKGIERNFTEAEKWYLKASEKGYDARLNLLQIWFGQGRLDDALRFAVEFTVGNPKCGKVWEIIGCILFKKGEFEMARNQLEKAARLFPRDIGIRKHLQEAYLQLGETENARMQELKIIELESRTRSSFFILSAATVLCYLIFLIIFTFMFEIFLTDSKLHVGHLSAFAGALLFPFIMARWFKNWKRDVGLIFLISSVVALCSTDGKIYIKEIFPFFMFLILLMLSGLVLIVIWLSGKYRRKWLD